MQIESCSTSVKSGNRSANKKSFKNLWKFHSSSTKVVLEFCKSKVYWEQYKEKSRFRIWQSLVRAVQKKVVVEFCQSRVRAVQRNVVWESEKV